MGVKTWDSLRSGWLFFGLILLAFISQSAFAQTETVLYTFSGPDGASPGIAPLAIDPKGNLYGTTLEGGEFRYGTVFAIPPAGGEKLLYSFSGEADGATPYGGVIFSDGALYGTTEYGGKMGPNCAIGCGTVFKVTGAGTETVLYSFNGPTSDGASPFAGVIRDQAGNLYGTTSVGGLGNLGTVFELTTSGKELLYSFKRAPDGTFPWGRLFRGSNGTLYGTTEYGGANRCSNPEGSCGAVFEITPAGESIIYSFGDSSTDGVYPQDALIGDASGNLYGTASAGGQYGFGTVFKLSKATGTWEEKILYNFTGVADGAYPTGGLIRDSRGNLYGTTPGGGANTAGTVFRVSPAGRETVLYSFCSLENCTDGAFPAAGLVNDKQGNLYGTTSGGGNTDSSCQIYGYGCGVVFKLTP
jgi:uncharacterized repeat protein (TIGR03803 family)